MKQLVFILWAGFFSALTTLASERKPIEAEINQVTVFLNGAQITRTGSLSVSEGRSTISLKGLSDAINEQSIQIRALNDFTILSVLHELDYLDAQTRSKQINTLEDKEEDLNDQIKKQEELQAAYKSELNMIQTNQLIRGEQSGVTADQLRQMADFYRSRIRDIRMKMLEISHTIRSLKKELVKITRQLAELDAQKDKPTGNIIVEIESDRAQTIEMEFAYLVRNAGWTPVYDLRVKSIKQPVNLAYKASVYQQTGNNWNQVSLTLSTADPSQSGQVPSLNPWLLNFQTAQRYSRKQSYMTVAQSASRTRRVSGRVVSAEDGMPIPGATIQVNSGNQGTVTDINGNFSLAVPAGSQLSVSFVGMESKQVPVNSKVVNIALEPSAVALDEVVVTAYGENKMRSRMNQMFQAKQEAVQMPIDDEMIGGYAGAVAEVQRYQTNAEFVIDKKYDIPSDGKEYAVQIQNYEMPAEYEYVCIPKLDNDAFLTAGIVDWESYNLLEGDIHLYVEGTYIGQSFLDLSTPSDTLMLSLGRDKDIVVQRTKLKDFSESQLIGSKRKVSRRYEISIRNTKDAPISIRVQDQFPISNNEDIEVLDKQYNNAEYLPDEGYLTWDLDIAAGETEKLNMGYTVRYPKKKRVIIE